MMQVKKRYYFSVIAFYLISISLYVVYQYSNTKQEFYTRIDSQLYKAALSVPQILPNGLHGPHLNTSSISHEEDWINIFRLSKQSDLMQVKFIYSTVQDQGQIFFTSCSTNDKELKENIEVHYYDPYDDAPQSLKNAFSTKKVYYEEYTDKWGTFRSVFIPITLPNGFTYVVGADVDVSFIREELNKEIFNTLFKIGLYILVLLPIILLYLRHLKQVNQNLKETVEKRTEQLQTSETKFREMFSRHSIPMLLINPENGKILDANEAASLYYGYSQHTLIGMMISQINMMDEKEIRLHRQNAMDHKGNSFVFNHRLSNGEIRIVAVHSAPIAYGESISLFSIIFDITDQKKSEELLIHAKEMAEASAKAKSEFLATMSHEIRTPMNGVLGMLSLLERSKLDTSQRHQLSVAKESATLLLGLVNDILDFSKIEAGKMELEILPFDLKKELSDFTELMVFKAEEKGLLLTLDTTEIKHSAILADPARLRQILMNLVSNAIKFTAQGSIEIHAKLVHIADSSMTRLIIDVKDTGIGIPSHKIPNLFEPFTQADGSTTRKYGGTGLGLSIVKHLCRLMNGTVNATSIPNYGSTFTIDIEVVLCDEEKIMSQYESEHLHDTELDVEWPVKTRILLVEDNPTNQMVAQGMLDELGLCADIAGNGKEAIGALNLSIGILPYSIILMDCHMPDMDGYEASRAIREGKAGQINKNIPIVAMTANAMQGDREVCLASGMNDYLAKPVNLYELKSVLIKWLLPELKEVKREDAPPPINETVETEMIWDKEGALERLGGKEKILTLIVKSFLNESPSTMELLKQALGENDLPNIELHAHSLKGSAGNIGAVLLQKKSKEMEFAAKEKDLQNAHLLFPELQKLYQETVIVLKL